MLFTSPACSQTRGYTLLQIALLTLVLFCALRCPYRRFSHRAHFATSADNLLPQHTQENDTARVAAESGVISHEVWVASTPSSSPITLSTSKMSKELEVGGDTTDTFYTCGLPNATPRKYLPLMTTLRCYQSIDGDISPRKLMPRMSGMWAGTT